MTYPEKLVFNTLSEAKINFQYNPRICGYYPDFLVEKMIIEVDGERWHNAERDSKRDAVLREAGYTIVRYPAKQIIKDCKIVLTNFIGV